MDLNAVQNVFSWESRLCVVVELLACDDMHIVSTPSQVARYVADKLARRRMIGWKESIEEEDPFQWIAPPFVFVHLLTNHNQWTNDRSIERRPFAVHAELGWILIYASQ